MSTFLDSIKQIGRAPKVSLHIYPLDPSKDQILLEQFLSYQFSSSVLIPVDAFSFTFSMPGVDKGIDKYIQDGDLVEVKAGDEIICTGIIDVVDIETTVDGGDVVTVIGRNLVGQLEDQSCVSSTEEPLYNANIPLKKAVGNVIDKTRLRGLKDQDTPSGNFIFATSPGESKLAALQRFVEPLNCIIWGHPDGRLVVGRPNMSQFPQGDLFCDRKNRISNVMSIKAIRSSTQIPNTVIPIWSGQESVVKRVTQEQGINNMAEGPTRLRNGKHFVQRVVVTSTPTGSDPQSVSDINAIKVGGSNILQSYALREIARSNVHELTVQAMVKNHFNDDSFPFMIDQVYNVNYSRAGIDEKMYLYQVEYSLDAKTGPKTSMHLCRLGCIVAGISSVKSVQSLFSSTGLPIS